MSDPVETVAPIVRADHVMALVGVLRTAKTWRTRRELAALLNQPPAQFERLVRAAASVSAPRIVSWPGSKRGYILFEHATDEEVEHCMAAFRSVIRDYERRIGLYGAKLEERRRVRAAGGIQTTMELGA